MELVQAILEGNRLALSRTLTLVENDHPTGRQVLNELFPHTGRAHLVGVTGAPGTGKSSLVNRLALAYRNPGEGSPPLKVAVVAVDPSSPFTGGAILGDRIRMRDLSGDPGVFVRSMASRGTLGGLAATTSGLVQVFDAAGFEMILIETVGAGQAEVDIARLAHTTLVIEAPGLGDDIQAIKAGILEIADVLVINKADIPGVENTERALRSMLELAHPGLWLPPIQRCIATEGKGISELVEAIARHRQHLENSGEWRQRDHLRLQTEFEVLLRETLVHRWRDSLSPEVYREVLENLFQRVISPYEAIAYLLDGNQPQG